MNFMPNRERKNALQMNIGLVKICIFMHRFVQLGRKLRGL